MSYRNLTQEQFGAVKSLAAHICENKGLKTIGDYKRLANEIIDEIEKGDKKFITDCENRVLIVNL